MAQKTKHWATALFSLFSLVSSSAGLAAVTYIGAERPAGLKLPASYETSKKYPLIVLLHGYSSNAEQTTQYLEGDLLQAKYDAIILAPNGELDERGNRRWNAFPQQDAQSIDDSAYILGLVKLAQERFSIDPNEIYVAGISNGGFMAYRLACDSEGLFRGAVSIAGAMFRETSLCRSKKPVSVLQIHGTADDIVPFESSSGNSRSLGAQASAQVWAERNGCQSFAERLESRDIMLQPAIPGRGPGVGSGKVPEDQLIINDQGARETDELVWTQCASATKVGLWRVKGGTHVPDYSGKNLLGQALEFFRQH